MLPLLFVGAVLGTFLFFNTPSSSAQSSDCQPIFGGGQTCTQGSVVALNKEVKNPQTNQFVDNLDTSTIFTPGDTISFRITVKNISQKAITNTNVLDVFPAFVDFSKGPGTYDFQTKTLTISVDKLDPGQSQVFLLDGIVESKDQLPTDQNRICVANQAVMSGTSQTSDDNARFCIVRDQTDVTPTPNEEATPTPTSKPSAKATPTPLPVVSPKPLKKTPETGPEAFGLISLIPMAGAGIFLRRKSK